MFSIYLLINKLRNRTYIGFTDDINRRICEHKNHKVKTTKHLGNFNYYILEEANNSKEARIKEKYWKSYAGRKKLKELFNNLQS